MNTKSKWMSATIAIVVASLIAVTVEPAAFANDAIAVGQSQQVVKPILPPRTVVRVAQVTPQTPGVASRPVSPLKTAVAQDSRSKSHKWIFIVAAAGAAGVAAAFLARGNGGGEPTANPTAPTITIGTPTVSQP